MVNNVQTEDEEESGSEVPEDQSRRGDYTEEEDDEQAP